MALVAHVDTKYASRDEVMSVPTPERTKTWGVVGHGQFLESLDRAIIDAEYKVIDEQFSLSADEEKGKMFTVLTLESKDGKISPVLGGRNSINKTLTVGVTGGRKAFVCDNLAFSGDFVRMRKHTGTLDQEELDRFTVEAVKQMASKFENFMDWVKKLDEKVLSRSDADALIMRAVETKVVPGSKVIRLIDMFINGNNPENDAVYTRSLGGFHGAVTQIWNNRSLLGTGERHRNLNSLLTTAAKELDEHKVLRN